MTPEELSRRLAPLIGREGEPERAPDPVNAPMIRHFCEAVDDRNPVYLDERRAAASVHAGLVAPPAMLQTWGMRGLRGRKPAEPARSEPRAEGERKHVLAAEASEVEQRGPMAEVLCLLDEAGFTSVVATNCRQEYTRYLRPGDQLSLTTRIRAVSDEKDTALGRGRFVDQLTIYRDAEGDEVARMEFRILKFAPKAAAASPTPPASRPPALRPRPAQTRDNAFFWQGVAEGRLLIQRCDGCGRLRHPPGPMCPSCHSLEWSAREASGRGRVYSFVVAHHPPIPPFEYPNLIALIELEEGTRLVSNLVGVDPSEAEIGMPVEVVFEAVDPELVLPLFQPVSGR
jgi:uncharacterized OB-fold protein